MGLRRGDGRIRFIVWATGLACIAGAALLGVLSEAPSQTAMTSHSRLLGKAAPPIAGPNLAGGRVDLDSVGHQWRLVVFMASWCGPCQEELPQLQALVESDDPARVRVIGVEYDGSDTAGLRSLAKSTDIKWPVILDPAADVRYGLTGIPQSYLVTPAGEIAGAFPGPITATVIERDVLLLAKG